MELVICRGLPASGKTTRARAWVAEDPVHRIRVNRDDLRRMGHEVWLGHDTERQIQAVRDATIASLLGKGVSVVCDDTNLPQRLARDLAQIARRAGAEVVVWDLTDVPLSTCVVRDEARENSVGESVIADMHKRYLSGRPYPLPLPEESVDKLSTNMYVPVANTPLAVIVDIDGTVALKGARSPFDETRVHEDRPNWPVIAAVECMHSAGYSVIFCSGRTEACRNATEEWLAHHLSTNLSTSHALFMRPVGDMRKDAIVKREIFDRAIRDHFHVVCVFDDRQQVVDAWRELGLTVFQVAPGNF